MLVLCLTARDTTKAEQPCKQQEVCVYKQSIRGQEALLHAQEAHIAQDSSVRGGSSMSGVQHGFNAGLVVLGGVHASLLQGISRQDVALAVDSRVVLLLSVGCLP